MKPDINVALLNAAQEIIGRFSPLIEDEYERSRLGSWGALILISAMKFNDSGSLLNKENEDIIKWLQEYSGLKSEEFNAMNSQQVKSIDFLDEENQNLRQLLDREFVLLEEKGNKVGIKSGLALMRSMHQRRKVSDLIGLLQQQES